MHADVSLYSQHSALYLGGVADFFFFTISAYGMIKMNVNNQNKSKANYIILCNYYEIIILI